MHGGVCITIPGDYVCNCTGTLYEGRICDRGLIQILKTKPEYSTLYPGYRKIDLKIRAIPDRGIDVKINTVNLSPSKTSNLFPDIFIAAQRVVQFTQTTNEVTVPVHYIEGAYFLTFSVSGKDETIFNVPDQISIIKQANESLPFRQLDISLTCSKQRNSKLLGIVGRRKNIYFLSSCAWNKEKTKTLGIVYSKLNDIAFPISVLGLDASGGIDQSKSTLRNRDKLDNFPPCTCIGGIPLEPNSTHVIELASRQVLSTAFVDEIQSKLLPNWIKLSATEDSSAKDKILDSDFKVNVVPRNNVSNQTGCESVIVDTTSGQFAILQHDSPLNLKLETSLNNFESINLPSPPSRGLVYCVAVNLLSGKQSPVYFGVTIVFTTNYQWYIFL